MECTIVTYHYVRPDARDDGVKGIDPRAFERQVEWLAGHYRILTYAEFQDAIDGRITPEGPTALITFDDGFVDHHEHAFPILRRLGVPGLFFVTTPTLEGAPVVHNVHKTHLLLAKLGAKGLREEVNTALKENGLSPTGSGEWPGIYRYDKGEDFGVKKLMNYDLPHPLADRILGDLFGRHIGDERDVARGVYLAREQVREMAEGGMAFGAHTRNHRVLSRLPVNVQREEIADAPRLLGAVTAQTRVPFCYPHGLPGAYTAETVRLVREEGYASAFTMVRRKASLPDAQFFEVPRFDTNDLPGGAP